MKMGYSKNIPQPLSPMEGFAKILIGGGQRNSWISGKRGVELLGGSISAEHNLKFLYFDTEVPSESRNTCVQIFFT